MKKAMLAVAVAVAMTLTLAGCGGTDDSSSNDAAENAAAESTNNDEAAVQEDAYEVDGGTGGLNCMFAGSTESSVMVTLINNLVSEDIAYQFNSVEIDDQTYDLAAGEDTAPYTITFNGGTTPFIELPVGQSCDVIVTNSTEAEVPSVVFSYSKVDPEQEDDESTLSITKI